MPALSIILGVLFVSSLIASFAGFTYQSINNKKDKKELIESLEKSHKEKLDELKNFMENQKPSYEANAIANYKISDEYKQLEATFKDSASAMARSMMESKEIQIGLLQKQIQQLEERRTGSSQIIGADLEDWCMKTLTTAFSIVPKEIEIKKPTNKDLITDLSITEKPDLLINFYFLNASGSYPHMPNKTITIECKSYDINKKTSSKKNNDHINKLINDSKNYNSSIAILATELEPEDQILSCAWHATTTLELEVVICRPQYLAQLIKLYYLGHKQLHEIDLFENNNSYNKDKISRDFAKRFEYFKNQLITVMNNMNKELKDLDKSLENIRKESIKAKKIVENKIQDSFKSIETSFLEASPKFDKDLKIIFDGEPQSDESLDTKLLGLESSDQ